MRPLSSKLAAIAPSATIEITEKARKMQAAGIDVISLSIGEPDFPTPAHITTACIDALNRGETHYAPGKGIPSLLSAISEKIEAENGFPCTADQVIVTCGAKDAIYEACEAVLSTGDEAIILDPSWVSYEPCIQIAGGMPVHHPLNLKTFQVDDSLLERITNRTRMIIVNSPSNPSGSVLNRESLRMVSDICQDHDLIALSDEIYEKLVYGQIHFSLGMFPGMPDRTITVNGFSKAYAMTGWRVGYACGPKEIVAGMTKIHQYTIMCVPITSQMAAAEALVISRKSVEEMKREYRRRRELVVMELNNLGLECNMPQGAFYAFPSIKTTGLTSLEFSRKLLAEEKVAVVPGTAFGDCCEGYIRISYASSLDNLKEALTRMKRFLEKSKRNAR